MRTSVLAALRTVCPAPLTSGQPPRAPRTFIGGVIKEEVRTALTEGLVSDVGTVQTLARCRIIGGDIPIQLTLQSLILGSIDHPHTVGVVGSRVVTETLLAVLLGSGVEAVLTCDVVEVSQALGAGGAVGKGGAGEEVGTGVGVGVEGVGTVLTVGTPPRTVMAGVVAVVPIVVPVTGTIAAAARLLLSAPLPATDGAYQPYEEDECP